MASSSSWLGTFGGRVGIRPFAAALVAGTSAVANAAFPAQVASAAPTTGSTYYVNSATDTGGHDCASIANTDCGIDDALLSFDTESAHGKADSIVFSSSITTFTVGRPVVIANF